MTIVDITIEFDSNAVSREDINKYLITVINDNTLRYDTEILTSEVV